MNYYIAYELHIASDLDIPELRPWINGSEADADINITANAIAEKDRQSRTQVGPFLFADTQNIFLTVPEIAHFRVESGARITYQILDDADKDEVRAFLLGSCIGAILMQRDYLVLHGCTIQIGDGCVVCVGSSTAGKSTLAATFMQSGYSVLSDDVCAIDSDGNALPGIPRIKLNQDVAKHLNIETDGLQTIRAACDNKFSLPLNKQFGKNRSPILAVYELVPEKEDLNIQRNLEKIDRLSILSKNVYRPRYAKALEKKPSNFQRCCKLVEQAHISRIIRPLKRLHIHQLKELIIDDLQQLKLIPKQR